MWRDRVLRGSIACRKRQISGPVTLMENEQLSYLHEYSNRYIASKAILTLTAYPTQYRIVGDASLNRVLTVR